MDPTPDESSEIEPPMTRAISAKAAEPNQLDPTLTDETRRPDREAGAPVHPAMASDQGMYTELMPGSNLVSGPGLTNRRGVVGRIEPGQTLYAKYQVLRRLGGGAMGDVWLVRHVVLKSEHALKVIVPNFASNQIALMRFQREFEVMASLRHEHAVTIYDACIDDDGGYIDMEYVDGRTIHEVLGMARSRTGGNPSAPLMPLDWIVRILDQLCDVLQVAHAKGIVHRDLKPSNMMLVGNRAAGKEWLKVLDFGIAKIRDDPDGVAGRGQEATEHRTQGFLGTPSYGSPEQAMGLPDLDGRADLYSVGIMLYEFVTGRLPFEGTYWQIMSQHTTDAPPSFSRSNPRLRPMPELERAILRVLAKDREQRPQDARELFEEIRQAVEVSLGRDQAPPTAPTWKAGPEATLPPTELARFNPSQAITQAETVTVPVAHDRVVEKIRPPVKIAPVRRSRIWMILIAAAVCLSLLVLVRLRRDPKDLSVTHQGPDPKKTESRKPADFETYWPSGYRPVEGYTEGMPWPEKVRRSSDETVFVRVGPGIYIPEGFELDHSRGLESDGWPRRIAKDGISFLRVPGGTWVMGAWDDPNAVDRADAPAHPVRLTGFYLQTTEVTHGQLEDYLNKVDASFPTDWSKVFNQLKQKVGPETARRFPASNVSRELAQRFGRWIGGQLPTEAQWEYAARSLGQNRTYVAGDGEPPDRNQARIDQIEATPAPVGSYSSDVTQQGILDMTGNLQEMCRDGWVSSYTKSVEAVLDPCAPPTEPTRPVYSIRGGFYGSIGKECSTTRRDDKLAESEVAENIGFRLVIECPDTRKPR